MNRALRSRARERVERGPASASPCIRSSLARLIGLWLVILGVTVAHAADTKFDFGLLQQRAKELAARPYVPAATDRVPEWLRTLSYDDYRLIEFDAAHSLWRREQLPFQV